MSSNLLDTIILVLPGMAAVYLLYSVGPMTSKPHTDYERTIMGLIFNAPGLIVGWAILSFAQHKRITLSEFESLVLHLPCLIYYLVLALILSVISALFWEQRGRKIADVWVNKSREGKRPQMASETAWELFVGPEKQVMLKIYPFGNPEQAIVGAFHAAWNSGDAEKGVLLQGVEVLTPYRDWYQNPLRTYIDTVTKTVYELYPTTAYRDAVARYYDDHNDN